MNVPTESGKGQVRLCPQKATWKGTTVPTESGKGQVRMCPQKASRDRYECAHRKRQGTGTNVPTESGMGQVRLCPQYTVWDRSDCAHRKWHGTGTNYTQKVAGTNYTQKAGRDRYELHRKWHGTGTTVPTESGLGQVGLCTLRKKSERGGAGGGVTKILAQTLKKYFNLSLLAKAAFKGIVLKSGSYCPQMSAMSLQE